MKKIKLMTVIAMAGIAGLTARASAPTGLDIVTIQATALVQNDDTEKGDTTKFHVTKIKVVTKDVLGLIADEFTNTPGITNKGAKLAVDDFFDGTFEVLDSTNGVILDDASDSPTNDFYDLFIETDNAVATGSEIEDTKESDSWTVATEVEYDSADDDSFFTVNGISAVKSKFSEDADSEAFKFAGTGEAHIDGSDAVVTKATVNGAGKDGDFESFGE